MASIRPALLPQLVLIARMFTPALGVVLALKLGGVPVLEGLRGYGLRTDDGRDCLKWMAWAWRSLTPFTGWG